MTYIAIKDYPEHGFKKGDIVGMNDKFAKKLIKEGIIKAAEAEKE